MPLISKKRLPAMDGSLMKKTLALSVLFALFLSPFAGAQERWSLDVTSGKLKPISLKTGYDSWHTWWYVVVTIKNDTGAARPLNLLARAETDTKKISRAVFRPMVRRAIEKKEGKKLANLISLRGNLENGKSVDAVIIFGDLDRLADRIDIHIQGLSAYIYRDGLKVYKEIREYVIPFLRRGDEYEVYRNPVKKLIPRWVVVTRERFRG